MPEPDPLDPRGHVERWGDDYYQGRMTPALSLIEAPEIGVLWRHWFNRRRDDD
jgi:hypothetical protein